MAITRAYKNATNFQERTTATPLIINGDMQIAQRGTSVTGVTGSGNPVAIDRFRNLISSLGTWTVSQSTDVPTGQGFTNSFKMDCTTAEASPSASSFNTLAHRFEGQNLQMLKKGTSSAESVTVSFWVKATKTGTNIVELYDQHNIRQISQAYTINSADTWEKKVVSFAGDTTGTLDNDNSNSLNVQFWLAAGSDRTSGTLNTSWATTTNANRVVGQVNHADSTSNNWYITGVQLEVGTFDANSIPPFQFEDRATSLARCQRYHYQVEPGANRTISLGWSHQTTDARAMVEFPVQMRARPTIVSSDGTDHFQFFINGTSIPVDNVTLPFATAINSKTGQVRNATDVTGLTRGQVGYFRFLSADASLGFDAEL